MFTNATACDVRRISVFRCEVHCADSDRLCDFVHVRLGSAAAWRTSVNWSVGRHIACDRRSWRPARFVNAYVLHSQTGDWRRQQQQWRHQCFAALTSGDTTPFLPPIEGLQAALPGAWCSSVLPSNRSSVRDLGSKAYELKTVGRFNLNTCNKHLLCVRPAESLFVPDCFKVYENLPLHTW